MLGKGVFPPAGKYIYGYDVEAGIFYSKSYFANSIKQGKIPFWDPYTFGGVPFLANPGLAAFYPPNWLFPVLPFGIALSLYYFFHLFLATVGAYWLMRKRKYDKLSSLASGLVFGMSGMMFARIFLGHVEYVASISYIPVIFGAVMEISENNRRRYLALGIISLTLQMLSGNPVVVFFTLELAGLYIIFDILTSIIIDRKRKKRWKYYLLKVLLPVLVILVAAGLSSIQIIPTIQLSWETIRSGGLAYMTAAGGSLLTGMLQMLFAPYSWGNPFILNGNYYGPWPNFFEFTYFVGKIAILLGIFAFTQSVFYAVKEKRANRLTVFSVASLIFFIAMSLGQNFWLFKIFYDIVPFFSSFRIPVRHMIIVVFLLSILSGIGMAKIKYPFLQLLVFVILVVELYIFHLPFIRIASLPTAGNDPKIFDIVKKDSDISRLYLHYQTWNDTRKTLDFDSGPFYKIQMVGGYGPVILNNYYRFIDLARGETKDRSTIAQFPVELPPIPSQSSILDFLNVKYLFIPSYIQDIGGNYDNKLSLVYKEKWSQDALYVNNKSFQRFFLVPKIEVYPAGSIGKILVEEKKNLSKMVLYGNQDGSYPSQQPDCSDNQNPGTVSIKEYSAEIIVLSVNANCNSILSSSEVYFPGWQATIDGRQTRIYESNLAFRSIFIPQGRHGIVMYYNPQVFYVGGVISVFSLFIYMVLLRIIPDKGGRDDKKDV